MIIIQEIGNSKNTSQKAMKNYMNGRRRQTKSSNADLESRISAMGKSATNSKNSYGESTEDKARNVPIECKSVLHGFKAESKEEKVKSVIVDSIKATGMTEEYTVDFPAIPITHAFVEFQNMKIRDRCVRSANMRKIDLDGRRIKISSVLEAEERFDEKR